jgi:hypothetical protein
MIRSTSSSEGENQRIRKFRNETSNKGISWIARKKRRCDVKMDLREMEEACILSIMMMIMVIVHLRADSTV